MVEAVLEPIVQLDAVEALRAEGQTYYNMVKQYQDLMKASKIKATLNDSLAERWEYIIITLEAQT